MESTNSKNWMQSSTRPPIISGNEKEKKSKDKAENPDTSSEGEGGTGTISKGERINITHAHIEKKHNNKREKCQTTTNSKCITQYEDDPPENLTNYITQYDNDPPSNNTQSKI